MWVASLAFVAEGVRLIVSRRTSHCVPRRPRRLDRRHLWHVLHQESLYQCLVIFARYTLA